MNDVTRVTLFMLSFIVLGAILWNLPPTIHNVDAESICKKAGYADWLYWEGEYICVRYGESKLEFMHLEAQ